MNRNKLIILIVCGVVLLAALCVVAVGLTAGWWTNGGAGNTDLPTNSQQTGSTDGTLAPDTTDPTTPTLIIGVDTEDEDENSGNGGSSGNGSNMIDFDDLLKPSGGNDKTESKPTESKPTEPETTEPETTEPEQVTPEETKPSVTEPEEDEGGGAVHQPGDIDVPL